MGVLLGFVPRLERLGDVIFDLPTGPIPTTTTTETTTTEAACPLEKKIGDTFCDDENNSEACQWDGGDCCPPHAHAVWNFFCAVRFILFKG